MANKNKYDVNNCGLPEQDKFQCPPADSDKYNGDLYRFGLNVTTITVKDTMSVAKRNTNFRNTNKNDYSTLCRAAGLSSFKTFQNAFDSLERMKKTSRGMAKKFKNIHKLSITNDDGVIKSTPSNNTIGHHTFWPTLDFDYFNNAIIVWPIDKG